jgi:hypothetical protein
VTWPPCDLPHMRYISFSYSDEITTHNSNKMVRLIQSPGYKHHGRVGLVEVHAFLDYGLIVFMQRDAAGIERTRPLKVRAVPALPKTGQR